MATYLRPSRPIAADVVLTADPATAMAIAQELVESPLMANHSYGLWGYSGTAADGRALSVHSTGIGGPSVAAVLAELAGHGVRRAIRIAAGAPLAGCPETGENLVATGALGADGTSRALGGEAEPAPNPALTERLLTAVGDAARPGKVLSTDLNGAHVGELAAWARAQGAVAHDLETAALFAAGRRAGVAVAAALVVANEPADDAQAKAALVALAALGTRAFDE